MAQATRACEPLDGSSPRKPLHAFVLGLPWRAPQVHEIQDACEAAGLPRPEWWPAPVAQYCDLAAVPDTLVAPRWRAHLAATPTHRGHLGCALGHLNLVAHAAATDARVLVLEDDAVVQPGAGRALDAHLAELDQLDPEWDVLKLGFSCCRDTSDVRCDRNLAHVRPGDVPVTAEHPLTVRLAYAFGAWAYVINGRRAAHRVQQLLPLQWAFDLELYRPDSPVRVYGTLPQLVWHPGRYRVSAWDYTVRTPRPAGRQLYLSATHL